MNVKPEQLASQFQNGLLPIYLIHGDEPLLQEESLDLIRHYAKKAGYLERTKYQTDRQFDWQRVTDDTQALSLFAEKKVIELKLSTPKVGSQGSKAITEFCDSPPDDTVLILSSSRIDMNTQKSKWFKAIDTTGCIVMHWPVDRSRLPQWIVQRARKLSIQLEPAAIEFLTDRVDGNLLAAKQELEHLALLDPGGVISLSQLEKSVSDGSQFNVFNLSDAYLAQDASYALRILQRMAQEGVEPMSILWTLNKDIAVIEALVGNKLSGSAAAQRLKQLRVIKKKQQPFQALSQKLTLEHIYQLMELAKSCDDGIKGRLKCNVWHIFDDMITLICTAQSLSRQ